MKSADKKLKHLTDLSDSIKEKSPQALKEFLSSFDKENEKIMNDYPAHITPENSHYYDSDREQPDNDALSKLKRFKQYRVVQP